MRTATLLSGLALVLALSANACAEQGTEATITDPIVDVRSGPSFSQDFYPTSKLKQGDKVRVLHQEGTGWLAIAPPVGSFSWINARDVIEQANQTAIVNVPAARLHVGSGLVNKPPEIAKFSAAKGTVLTVLDPPQTSGGETWLPIMPAPKEERYIPVTAIRSSPVVQQTVQPPIAVPTAFTSTASKPPNSEADSLRAQAEKADLSGNLSDAIQHYEQLARQTSDSDEQRRYLNRVNFLRDTQRNATLVSRQKQAGSTQSFSTSNVENRMAASPVYSNQPLAYYTPPRPATSQYCYIPEPCNTVRLAAPIVNHTVATTSNLAPAINSQPALWYGPAYLRRTGGLFMDGKPVYALETGEGRVHSYVTAGANVDLETMVNRTVQLYGPMTYHGLMRTNYMTALQARVLQ